jgi:hypothetical protein
MRTRIALAAALAVVSTGAGTLAGAITQPVAAATTSPADPAGAPTAGPDTTPDVTPPDAASPSTAAVAFVSVLAIAPVVWPTPAPVAAAPTAPAPAAPAAPPAPTDATSVATADWQCIRVHESGDRFNSALAPSGAYGIVQRTWRSFGQPGWPFEAPPVAQDLVALALFHRYGWSPWSTRWACGL